MQMKALRSANFAKLSSNSSTSEAYWVGSMSVGTPGGYCLSQIRSIAFLSEELPRLRDEIACLAADWARRTLKASASRAQPQAVARFLREDSIEMAMPARRQPAGLRSADVLLGADLALFVPALGLVVRACLIGLRPAATAATAGL